VNTGRAKLRPSPINACWNCKEITTNPRECHLCGADEPHRLAGDLGVARSGCVRYKPGDRR
jgi:hypothetical protein